MNDFERARDLEAQLRRHLQDIERLTAERALLVGVQERAQRRLAALRRTIEGLNDRLAAGSHSPASEASPASHGDMQQALLAELPILRDTHRNAARPQSAIDALIALFSRSRRRLLAHADQVRSSPWFDAQWYVRQGSGRVAINGDPAMHYLTLGRRIGLEPGPRFSARRYLARYPDVASHDIDPLVHYILHGESEGRAIDPPEPAEPAGQARSGLAPAPRPALPVNEAWQRFRPRKAMRALRAQAELIRQSEYFESAWYVEHCGFPVGETAHDPAMHFLTAGARAGKDPGPRFSCHRYIAAYPDVGTEGINPLVHFVLHGQNEGRTAFSATAGPELRMAPAPEVVVQPSIAAPPASPPPPAEAAQVRAPAEMPRASTPEAANRAPSMLFVSGEPDTPGNTYRVLHYVEAAHANGCRADWVRGDALAEHMERIAGFDILVIWRVPWDETMAEAIATARRHGRTVVFDCDDLMTEPRLATLKFIDGIRSQFLAEDGVQEFYGRVRQTMLAADYAFTTSDQLAFHMRWSGKTTFVNQNGFNQATHDLSRRSARAWAGQRDGLIRIGYAGGSRTHQRDLGLAMDAICRILRENAHCRLVLFRTPDGKTPLIDVEEYPQLDDLLDQIEWRPLQPLASLPTEMARFDINLAPLEVGNPFCEAKSQLKFFEAGLVNCPTIASPTGPFRDFMVHGKTGFLAVTGDDWYACLRQLVTDAPLRERIGRNAYLAALARFGPRRRALQFGCVIDQIAGGPAAARAFALSASLARNQWSAPLVYPSETVFENDKGGFAELSVIIPLYNYPDVVIEALDSIRDQTLETIDLIIVDGFSTDNSLDVALKWARRNAARFNRIVVLKNKANYGLGFCRNSGFEAADTPYVLPLDADNRLLPECCEGLLAAIKQSGAAYVYPTIQHFGASTEQISNAPYSAQRFAAGNYVDAMALVSKEAWAMVGGYDHVRHGWEDYDFWVRIAELGLVGEWCPRVLAEYRVHQGSMLKTQTTVDRNYRVLNLDFARRHPWVALIDTETRRHPRLSEPNVTADSDRSRLDELLPILRCPASGQKLSYDEARSALISHDGMVRWPIVAGRPCLSEELAAPQVMPTDHISNALPDEAAQIVKETKGWVLNLSGGGSQHKFAHVVEMEFAVFSHTDVVGDAHHLPFDDHSFEAVIVMNAFERYRDPVRVAAEIHRVLKPGGRLHVRTAFLQPLHEKPYHFYNCTRYGMEHWFQSFETEQLHVSTNFAPNHTLAWTASEAETALRTDVSSASSDAFLATPIGKLVELWRDPSRRQTPLWTDFETLSQTNQEIISAGFELFARRPDDLPKI